MTSVTPQQDSHRKHRRCTSVDENEKSSKRHKHRHHHRRHRHHRSKKHEEETKHEGDDIGPPVTDNNSVRIDDDVEEGEILDEDNLESKKIESGEIQAVDIRDGVNSRNPVCSVCLLSYLILTVQIRHCRFTFCLATEEL